MGTISGDDDSYDEIDKRWRKIWRNTDSQIHRDGDLPAVILSDGSEVYYKNGWYHRDDGKPAVIWYDGIVEYWIDGVKQK